MPEDIQKAPATPPKQQAVDVVAPIEEKSEAQPDKTTKNEQKPAENKPKKPIGAIIMALLIGGGLIAVAIVSQLQK